VRDRPGLPRGHAYVVRSSRCVPRASGPSRSARRLIHGHAAGRAVRHPGVGPGGRAARPSGRTACVSARGASRPHDASRPRRERRPSPARAHVAVARRARRWPRPCPAARQAPSAPRARRGTGARARDRRSCRHAPARAARPGVSARPGSGICKVRARARGRRTVASSGLSLEIAFPGEAWKGGPRGRPHRSAGTARRQATNRVGRRGARTPHGSRQPTVGRRRGRRTRRLLSDKLHCLNEL
jgi:hypothetical protein